MKPVEEVVAVDHGGAKGCLFERRQDHGEDGGLGVDHAPEHHAPVRYHDVFEKKRHVESTQDVVVHLGVLDDEVELFFLEAFPQALDGHDELLNDRVDDAGEDDASEVGCCR